MTPDWAVLRGTDASTCEHWQQAPPATSHVRPRHRRQIDRLDAFPCSPNGSLDTIGRSRRHEPVLLPAPRSIDGARAERKTGWSVTPVAFDGSRQDAGHTALPRRDQTTSQYYAATTLAFVVEQTRRMRGAWRGQTDDSRFARHMQRTTARNLPAGSPPGAHKTCTIINDLTENPGQADSRRHIHSVGTRPLVRRPGWSPAIPGVLTVCGRTPLMRRSPS